MEPLALLCNLYGEGPSTLRRLEHVGVDTLAVLASLDIETLTERTGWERVDAEPFLREAQALMERLGTGLLEAEAEAKSPGNNGLAEVIEEEEAEGVESREEVLSTWRELDEDESPPVTLGVIVPQPPLGSIVPGLGMLEVNIPAETLVRLGEIGVGTVADFLAASPLVLAKELNIGYTRVRRLQFLASRQAHAHDPPARGACEPGPGGPFA